MRLSSTSRELYKSSLGKRAEITRETKDLYTTFIDKCKKSEMKDMVFLFPGSLWDCSVGERDEFHDICLFHYLKARQSIEIVCSGFVLLARENELQAILDYNEAFLGSYDTRAREGIHESIYSHIGAGILPIYYSVINSFKISHTKSTNAERAKINELSRDALYDLAHLALEKCDDSIFSQILMDYPDCVFGESILPLLFGRSRLDALNTFLPEIQAIEMNDGINGDSIRTVSVLEWAFEKTDCSFTESFFDINVEERNLETLEYFLEHITKERWIVAKWCNNHPVSTLLHYVGQYEFEDYAVGLHVWAAKLILKLSDAALYWSKEV